MKSEDLDLVPSKTVLYSYHFVERQCEQRDQTYLPAIRIKVKNQIQHLIENKAFENPKTP